MTKDIKTIETLFEVAEAINFHENNLSAREIDKRIYIDNDWIDSLIKINHNIAVIERLLLILNKKYNRILKQLNDEC